MKTKEESYEIISDIRDAEARGEIDSKRAKKLVDTELRYIETGDYE